MPETDRSAPPVVIKKYANRRLYDTEGSIYITLDSLAAMVRQGRNFVVFDAKTGDDITRSVLTQIIVEEETKGRNMLPEAFLRQLIGLYGDSMQGQVPEYLEHMMEQFAARRANQDQTTGGPGGKTAGSRANATQLPPAGQIPSRPGEPARSASGALHRPTVVDLATETTSAVDDATRTEIRRLQTEIERLNRELAAFLPGSG